MTTLTLATALNTYLMRHLGTQYTAAQVTVYHHGQRIASQSVSTPQSPASAHTHPIYFDLASLTKLFTTTAVLQAISAGKIGLQTPLVEVIPEFGASGGRKIIDSGINPHTYAVEPPNPQFEGQFIDPASVSIWHLLTHTSGLAPWRKLYDDDAPPPPTEPDSIPRHERWTKALKFICESPFIAPAGYAVRYSDLGFLLLAEVVTRLTLAPNPVQNLIAQLFPDSPESVGYIPSLIAGGQATPLQKTNLTGEQVTPLHHTNHRGEQYAPLHFGEAMGVRFFAPTEYDTRWRKRRVQAEVHDENACGLGGIAGHAGLFGTADALAQFGAKWCAADLPDIHPDLARDATRVHAETHGERRGLGWMVRSLGVSSAGTKFGVNSYGHTGFVGNMLWIDPDQKLVVACLTNNVYYGRGKAGLLEFRVGLNDLIWEALCSS